MTITFNDEANKGGKIRKSERRREMRAKKFGHKQGTTADEK